MHRKIKRIVNLPLVLLTVVILGVAIPGGRLYYKNQCQRLSASLLHQAKVYEQREDWAHAAEYLLRHAVFQQGDRTVVNRLVHAMQQTEAEQRSSRAFGDLVERAAFIAPEESAIQTQLIDTLYQTGQFHEASLRANELLKRHPSNLTARKTVALATYAMTPIDSRESLQTILGQLHKILETHPGEIQVAEACVEIHREHLAGSNDERHDQLADAVMDNLVHARPGDADVFFSRYLYRVKYGLDGAHEDLEQVLRLEPEHSRAQFALAAIRDSQETAQ